jgi:predicted metalloprotease
MSMPVYSEYGTCLDRAVDNTEDDPDALEAASAIGDDRLQKQASGKVVPESFTHGTSRQRVEWFRRGIESGDVAVCDTFDA